MIVLVGEGSGPIDRTLAANGWGRLWVARTRNIRPAPGNVWALDNGVFRDWDKVNPFDPADFDSDAWLRVLEKAQAVESEPTFAVVPDAPANASGTLRMADEWLPKLPSLRWYLAAQDGLGPKDFEPFLGSIDGVFLGGSTPYKATADEWATWCADMDLGFHYGRCGTLGRVAHARHIGADSVDSAFPMWTEARWRAYVDACLNGPLQLDMMYARSEP